MPFGTIDTPDQGGTVSGVIPNYGWALAPKKEGPFIPFDGSTINVFVDGISLGTVHTYGGTREDLDKLFPGYSNSGRALGLHVIDTTLLTNGLHTIVWNAMDNLGRTGGLGSRFFRVANSGASLTHADAAARRRLGGRACEAAAGGDAARGQARMEGDGALAVVCRDGGKSRGPRRGARSVRVRARGLGW